MRLCVENGKPFQVTMGNRGSALTLLRCHVDIPMALTGICLIKLVIFGMNIRGKLRSRVIPLYTTVIMTDKAVQPYVTLSSCVTEIHLFQVVYVITTRCNESSIIMSFSNVNYLLPLQYLFTLI